ncbi:sensor histidine kinase [Ketobacter sp.]
MTVLATPTQPAAIQPEPAMGSEFKPEMTAIVSAVKSGPDLQDSLQSAFTTFNRISNQLTTSYHELEQRVGELQSALAETDRERISQHSARELLADRLDVIVSAIPVGFILLDGRGVVVKANSLARTLLSDDILHTKWIDVINQCFSRQPPDGHELLLKSGRLVSVVTQSLNSEPGQIIVIADQTETRVLQNKLNHSRKLSDMGRMTASLAHQIRTPLSTAILYADHLASPQLEEARRLKYANKLKQRLQHLEQQVRDMLIFSKSGVVLKDNLSLGQIMSVIQAQAEDVKIQRQCQIDFADSIPAGSVRCNVELLTSAFSNLFENASEACRDAGIQAHILLRLKKPENGLIEFLVSDNGPGLSAEAEQVTEPFFTTKATGTGLGLSIVRAVVEAHGGTFDISNRPEGGACAQINLPVEQCNNASQGAFQ